MGHAPGGEVDSAGSDAGRRAGPGPAAMAARAAVGVEEGRAPRGGIGLGPDAFFATPDDVVAAFRAHDGAAAHQAWNERIAAHPRADASMSSEIRSAQL